MAALPRDAQGFHRYAIVSHVLLEADADDKD